VANVFAPSSDLSAGIQRRQLFHFAGIYVEIERSKTYRFCLVLLRDRGIPEATCIVVDVLDPSVFFVCVCVLDFPQIMIALQQLTFEK
jgi:hypothetical protein